MTTPPPLLDGAKVVRLLDELVQRAVESRASDIHLEPKEHRVNVRMRVDGVMIDALAYPVQLGAQILQRIKVLGNMDIAERRLPQDGVFALRMPSGVQVSLRASSFPSVGGEKIVLRLLMGGRAIRLDQLGMFPEQLDAMKAFTRAQGGLLLVTGPTGAGKTSTLYAALEAVDTLRRNVVTLEDPVEVQIYGITQGQVAPKAGFGFADGLRSILRQDPDVILVGEMRDPETAKIAIQAGLTGHLVLSTLHTSNAVDTITRLLDIGLEPYVVANAVIGVVAQRLVRRVCKACAVPGPPPPTAEVGFALPEAQWLVAVGCDVCHRTGYRGRSGIFEVVPMDDELRGMVKQRPGIRELKDYFARAGIATLRRRGVARAAEGVTTLAEVIRLT